MRFECLAMIDYVEFDLFKHAVEISKRYRVLNGDSGVDKRVLVS